jgi:hypothetical protein
MSGPLNPVLYRYLQAKFGNVKITAPGEQLQARVVTTDRGAGAKRFVKDGSHEQYWINCPLCGDQKGRLGLSYRWLTDWEGWGLLTHLACCYNSDCPVRSPAFWEPIAKELTSTAGVIELIQPPQPVQVREPDKETRLPTCVVPLQELSSDHPANLFLLHKYTGLTGAYLGSYYGACFCYGRDPDFRLVQDRIIFPIHHNGKLVGWQGRTILPTEREPKRWILSPGYRKTPYGIDRIGSTSVPIICEGITSSIACGPSGMAIFGKTIDDKMAREIGAKYRTCVVCLDPETSVPDPRAHDKVFAAEACRRLNQFCELPVYQFNWAPGILETARRKVAGEDVQVPDPADLGLAVMHQLLSQQVPLTHRSLV